MKEVLVKLQECILNMTEEEKEMEYESITHAKFYTRWVEKIHQLSKARRDILIRKCVKKYTSQEYKDKEYKLGYEPREELFWLLHEYALKYGKSLDSEGDAYFPTANYLVDNKWHIEVMFGQGSVINVKEYVEEN